MSTTSFDVVTGIANNARDVVMTELHSIDRVAHRASRRRLPRRFASLATSVALVLIAACTTPLPPPGPGPQPRPEPKPQPEPQPPAAAKPILVPTSWAALPGWVDDPLTDAWPAFLASCAAVKKPEWAALCTAARQVDGNDTAAIRNFFESRFVPNQVTTIDGNDSGLVTGYYEPLLRGSRTSVAPYLTPLYALPDDLLIVDMTSLFPELKGKRLRGKLLGRTVVPYPPRGDLASSNALRGKELLWVDDPIEAFFLEIQGSGRVELNRPDGATETVRLAYADQNGQPYKSIGRWLVDRGEMTLSQASMQSIKSWAIAHPERLDELLAANPSEVFFKEEPIADPSRGPKGALGVALTPQRSIAVDARVVPLGSPVYLATTQPLSDAPLRRLVMAQDTGGAIAAAANGAVRADFFWGFGADAANAAGRMKQQGKMWVLVPR
jgi:membrane-bound lytic murein transglycosylase A